MCLDTGIGCVADFIKPAKFEQKDGHWLEARKLENVKNKMKFGRKLSFHEKVFLKTKAQDLYEKAVKIEEERDEFRRALANCKTKQEAITVKTLKSLELQTETKSTEDLEFTTIRMMAMLDEFSEFAKSRYKV